MRRFTRPLAAVALAATMVAGTAGWVSGNSRRAVTGPPPGSASWRADGVLGRQLPDPGRATPAQVREFFDGLSAAQRQELVRRHPSVVGNLDGAPLELRYRANSLALRASHDARYAGLGASGRQILAFDPRGRGQVAEVFGDLRSARHVSVVVPGSDIDAGTFDRHDDAYGTPAGMARSLYAETGPGSAVIAWAGYTTPVGVPGEARTNSHPPSLLVLALASAQSGAAVLLHDRIGRALRRPALWAPVVVVNLSAMTILCWHQTAMLAAAVPASFAGAVPGLTTGPDSVGWIVARTAWLPLFAALLVLISRHARRFERPWETGTRSGNVRRAAAGLLAACFAVFALRLA